jgi:hypothetical protein
VETGALDALLLLGLNYIPLAGKVNIYNGLRDFQGWRNQAVADIKKRVLRSGAAGADAKKKGR